MAGEPWAFDSDEAGPTFQGALAFQLPGSGQVLGPLSPTPAGNVSDHSAEGAPWTPTAGDNFERQGGWAWQETGSELGQAEYLGQHEGPSVPYDAASRDSYYGQTSGPQPGWNHDGTDGGYFTPISDDWGPNHAQPNQWAQVAIGKPFTIDQGASESRYLNTDQWDSTGKRIRPEESPSALHQLYGSEHFTRPRLTPSEHVPLSTWAWAEGQQFPASNPGYWGVSANEPNLAPRPQGAVVAQMPGDPYVAPDNPGPPDSSLTYDLGF
jgi:hypothetical protein